MKSFKFKSNPSVNPSDLVGNINLSLHHHMAPPGETDAAQKEENDRRNLKFRKIEGINPKNLVGNINLALHHHMAPPGIDDSKKERK